MSSNADIGHYGQTLISWNLFNMRKQPVNMNTKYFKQLVLPAGKKLFHFARLLLKDDNEAQDAVQEVYIKLWNMRDELANIKNIEAFAMRITRNWCLDRLKSKKPTLISDYSDGYDHMHDSATPDGLLEENEKMLNFRRIIEDIPEPQKTVLQLRDMEGYEYEDIARTTGMKVNAVRVALSRARKKVRESFLKIEQYEDRKNQGSA